MKSKILHMQTRGHGEIVNLSPLIQDFLSEAGLQEGLLSVFVPGSTAAVTAIEYEEGVLEDLEAALEGLAPAGATYRHNLRWGDGNGFSHVRAAFLGPSLCVPVLDGKLQTGTWQQVVLVECDNRPRQRRVQLCLLSDCKGA